MTILRMDSTLYWLVHEPLVPLTVKASMQIDPPAVTCPAPVLAVEEGDEEEEEQASASQQIITHFSA